MQSEDKEHRQCNHRPSYQHENPVEEHHDIIAQIRGFEYEVLREPHRAAVFVHHGLRESVGNDRRGHARSAGVAVRHRVGRAVWRRRADAIS